MSATAKKLDLAALSKAEKLRLFELLEEQERRAREKLDIYKPNDGQMLVHRSDAALRCVFSGNGAGKTALTVNEVLWWVHGYNPITNKFSKVPARVIVLLDAPDKVTDVWLPEISKWTNLQPEQLHKRGKPYVSQIVFSNGSEILFMFHQQEPLLFESIELDYMAADEPPPRPVYIALRRGARKKNRSPKFLIVGTPITGSWMRKEISEPWAKGELKNTECFKFGTIENEKNLADGYIQSLSAILTEKERRIRLEGEFYDLEGLALAHLFDRHTHVMEPFVWPEEFPVSIAIDPHPVKAHFAVMVGADKDNQLFVLKELKMKAVARDFARELRRWMQGYKVVDIVSDSLGSAESTSGEGFKSFIQVLRDEGVRVRATDWDEKNDEDFIERIRDTLTIPIEPNNFGECLPKLRVLANCVGLISDIENVTWTRHRLTDEYKPKLDITNKDYLSCLKYALATNITFTKHKAKAYRPVKGAETYGISKNPSRMYYRRRLNRGNHNE